MRKPLGVMFEGKKPWLPFNAPHHSAWTTYHTEADENRIKSYSYNLVSNQTIFVFLMSLKKLPVASLYISAGNGPALGRSASRYGLWRQRRRQDA
jgi:hypothetical protein